MSETSNLSLPLRPSSSSTSLIFVHKLIEGYRDVRDLVRLVKAMQEVGFSEGEISAYMGGNFYRVLRSCIG